MDRKAKAQILNQLSMVTWDRWIDDGSRTFVYGWIDRDDGRSDFVVLEFVNGAVGFVTSSSRYSDAIHALLYGEQAADDHMPCQRVEDEFGEMVYHKTSKDVDLIEVVARAISAERPASDRCDTDGPCSYCRHIARQSLKALRSETALRRSNEELAAIVYDSLLSSVARPLDFALDGESPLSGVHLMDAAREAVTALRSQGAISTDRT